MRRRRHGPWFDRSIDRSAVGGGGNCFPPFLCSPAIVVGSRHFGQVPAITLEFNPRRPLSACSQLTLWYFHMHVLDMRDYFTIDAMVGRVHSNKTHTTNGTVG